MAKAAKKTPNQLTHCPDCGAQLLPRGTDWLDVRMQYNLTQRDLAAMLGVKASHIAYLEAESRFPSAALILRFRAVKEKLAKQKIKQAERVLKEASRPSRSRPASKKKAA